MGQWAKNTYHIKNPQNNLILLLIRATTIVVGIHGVEKNINGRMTRNKFLILMCQLNNYSDWLIISTPLQREAKVIVYMLEFICTDFLNRKIHTESVN